VSPPSAPKTGWGTPTYEEMLDKKRAQESQYRQANNVGVDPQINAREDARTPVLGGAATGRRSQNQQDGQYFATLPLGANMTEEQRRKEDYKRDLQKQMTETAYARKRERAEGSLVNNTGAYKPHQQITYTTDSRPYRRAIQKVAGYDYDTAAINKLDNLSPRSNAVLGRRQPVGVNIKDGLNPMPDLGLDQGILHRPIAPIEAPAGLQYQPS